MKPMTEEEIESLLSHEWGPEYFVTPTPDPKNPRRRRRVHGSDTGEKTICGTKVSSKWEDVSGDVDIMNCSSCQRLLTRRLKRKLREEG